MACVTINSTFTVFPSHPTPNGRLPLSEIDQMVDWNHFTTIYVYKSSPNNPSFSNMITSLKDSLSQVLVPYYPMAGRLHWIGGGRLELDCCAAGVQFIEASSDVKLDDYGDFAPTDALRQQLVPTFDYNNSPIEEMPVLMAQVTRFSCGGLVLGIAIPHTLADGISAMTFINLWASIAQGEKTMESVLQPFHDRTKVLQPEKPILPPTFHHQEFDQPPSFLNYSDYVDGEGKKEPPHQVALLKLTEEQVEKLKKRANDTNTLELKEGVRPFSRYESITGHIWVCACKARNRGEKMNSHRQPTVTLVSVDIRRRLNPPLPNGFFGNASMMSVTPTCEFGDLTTKPLSYAAGKIREGILKITDEYVKSAIKLMAREEEMGWVRNGFLGLGSTSCEEDNNSYLLRNPNLYVGGWITLSFYDADFGWGKPSYVGPAHMVTDGESFIMPASPHHDGSLVVVICLHTNYMDDFKNLFYQNL